MPSLKTASKKRLLEAVLASEEGRLERQTQNKADIQKLFEAYLKGVLEQNKVRLNTLLVSGTPLTGPTGLRKELAAIDLGYFARAYLPHYFSRTSPPFHLELDAIWEKQVLKGMNPLTDAQTINRADGCKSATAAPRGHAKSTNFTFKDALHAVLYGYKHYIMLLSDSYAQAAGFLSSIAEELESNDAIIEDFGHLVGKVWREDVLITSTKIKIEALGAGQKIRGRKHRHYRPDLIILDDVENDELVRTPEQRKKLYSWFTKAVAKAGDTYTDILFIGTILHYDSLLSNILKNPGYTSRVYKAVSAFNNSPLWDIWEAKYTDLSNPQHEADADAFYLENKSEMLEGTEVLWPDKLDYYALMKIKVEDGAAAFNSELQNEPIDPDNCMFNAEWFDYYNPLELDFSAPEFIFYGAVDPSLGKTKKSDFSAIQLIAKDIKTGYMYSVDADIERRHPDRIIDDVLAKVDWIKKTFGKRFEAFGCETVQFQWFLKEKLAEESAKRGIYLPLVEINTTTDKLLRLQTLQPDIKNKYIKFDPRQKRLLQQLREFPMADHDDGPDALEMCRSLATKRKRRGFIHVKGIN